jgi:hypothetical protein
MNRDDEYQAFTSLLRQPGDDPIVVPLTTIDSLGIGGLRGLSNSIERARNLVGEHQSQHARACMVGSAISC